MNLRWLITAFISASVLAFLHIWAVSNFLYWKYRWFDTPMHILGGATIGLIAIGLIGKTWRPITYAVIIIVAAFAWEFFEAVMGIAVLPGVDYTWDTAHDVLNDSLGAIAVYLVARHTIWPSDYEHDRL
jgi:hypothetical protein